MALTAAEAAVIAVPVPVPGASLIVLARRPVLSATVPVNIDRAEALVVVVTLNRARDSCARGVLQVGRSGVLPHGHVRASLRPRSHGTSDIRGIVEARRIGKGRPFHASDGVKHAAVLLALARVVRSFGHGGEAERRVQEGQHDALVVWCRERVRFGASNLSSHSRDSG